jgi:hypothetical protein
MGYPEIHRILAAAPYQAVKAAWAISPAREML